MAIILRLIGRFLPCSSIVGLVGAVGEALQAHADACDERITSIEQEIAKLRELRDTQAAERAHADRLAYALSRLLSE